MGAAVDWVVREGLFEEVTSESQPREAVGRSIPGRGHGKGKSLKASASLKNFEGHQ